MTSTDNKSPSRPAHLRAQAEAVPIGEARGDVVEHAGGVHGLEEPAGKPGRKLGPEDSPLIVYRYPH